MLFAAPVEYLRRLVARIVHQVTANLLLLLLL